MLDIQADMQRVQGIAHEAYICSGGVLALLDCAPADNVRLASALDKTAAKFESSAVELRNLCERNRPRLGGNYKKQAVALMELAGKASVSEQGWVHLELSSLLPHCTREAPAYLTDTISRLMDDLEWRVPELPWFESAMLVIDEHCDFHSQRAFDQDNKGWKAIPNALKGRLFGDDNQFTLSLCLLSMQAEIPSCHIYVLPLAEADDFFFMRHGNYPI